MLRTLRNIALLKIEYFLLILFLLLEFLLVHNGIITNYKDIKNFLVKFNIYLNMFMSVYLCFVHVMFHLTLI